MLIKPGILAIVVMVLEPIILGFTFTHALVSGLVSGAVLLFLEEVFGL